MVLKKVFWFGTVSLKVFRGLEPGRGRVVDARTITPAIMNQFGNQLIIADAAGEEVEHVGKNVSQIRAKSLFPGLDFSSVAAPKVEEPVAQIPEEPVEEVVAPEIEELAVFEAQQLPVIEPSVSEQTAEEKVKSKKGRKSKIEQPSDILSNDGTTDISVE